ELWVFGRARRARKRGNAPHSKRWREIRGPLQNPRPGFMGSLQEKAVPRDGVKYFHGLSVRRLDQIDHWFGSPVADWERPGSSYMEINVDCVACFTPVGVRLGKLRVRVRRKDEDEL